MPHYADFMKSIMVPHGLNTRKIKYGQQAKLSFSAWLLLLGFTNIWLVYVLIIVLGGVFVIILLFLFLLSM